jgi:branched-chain amino acid transport system ATP-binding protein
MAGGHPMLELQDVKVWFGGVRAVDGVSMRLEAGRLYGIIGPNGSGKTTLINAISRLTRLTSGTIRFDGEDVSHAPAHHVSRMGMARTFQAIRLLPTLDVRENILLGTDELVRADGEGGSWRARARARARRAAQAADEAIERLGLQAVAREQPSNLPYGTQRRVEIARAVASGCRLLLLDEPIAGMSREERDEIAEVLRALRGEGLTQVLIEHDLRMVLRTCEHLYVLNLGTNLAEGEPAATVARPAVQEAYLGRVHVGA